MNEEQAFKAVRNALTLENMSRDLAAKVTPEIFEIYKQVRQLIREMPAGEIARDMHYRRVLRQLSPLFRELNDDFFRILDEGLRAEAVAQAHWAESFLRVAERNPELVTGLSVAPAVGSGPVGVAASAGVTRTQVLALVDETEVLGKRLTELFEWEDLTDSPYMAAQVKKIDRVVKQGFLAGETNDEIARNLAKASKGTIRDTRAIARTAVMDMSQRAHERMWDANSDRIVLWEWDATMDYRVCPICYPLDGKRVKDRSKLPHVPIHPNCRCRVLPVTRTALALEKEDMAEGIKISTIQVGRPESGANVRRYKTKAKVDGKKVDKFAQDYVVPKGERPTMGFFLLRANNETRRAVLGAEDAKRFAKLVKGTSGSEAVLSANDALRAIVANPSAPSRYRRPSQ